MDEAGPRRGTRVRRRAGEVPQALGLLGREDRDLLKAWLRRDNQTSKRQTLLEAAGATGLEQAEALCDRLLREGWIARRERLVGGSWQWEAIIWLDLGGLKQLLGVGSRSQREQYRGQALCQARAWLPQVGDAALGAAMAQAIDALEQEAAIQVATLQRRLGLLQALRGWCERGEQGTRRDFALQAADRTKGIGAADWRWLEQFFALEALGVSAFLPLLSLSGTGRLQSTAGSIDLPAVSLLALPLADVLALTACTAPTCWWLIENRASFERQCLQRAQPGACIVWLPGRPSPGWQRAMAHLLRLAPAPLRISADIDPAGVDMALTMGRLWQRQGLEWRCSHMDEADLEAARQLWPLNAYDHALLERLLADAGLPPELRRLCEAMRRLGRKAEQEGWL
ncbi:DUF2399 domain-containing protein [Corticibacter populi]|uniref:DUF2399 domain-containing protein n=2 Tax=Corticibacter populi TaxID=1550736 RepID=A0A3M6QV93_9BURK|nr:DUF2399 domain-containing protein [Corticibacter populi]